MQEFEKKMMLTKEEYYFLRQSVGQNVESIFQTNYYFDTENFSMNKQGITCRVRKKNGKYIATVKTHNIKKSDCSIEENLAEKDYFDVNIFSPLGVRLQGDLLTERMVIFKDSGCEMVLDRNIYLGTTDYELEIEYLSEFEEKADELLNKMINTLLLNGFDAVQESVHGKSKSERFFERKLQQKRNS